LNDSFHFLNSRTKIVIICGTNGKTTTAKLIKTILKENHKKFFLNSSGANLLNGIASSVILSSSLFKNANYDFAIFEIDENSLPEINKTLNPDYIIALNLFRDQLDRYGEIDTITKKWKESFKNLTSKSVLILNADDPQIAYLGNNLKNKKLYFGLNEKNNNKISHGADSIYCPECFNPLVYENVYFSHLGNWKCQNCKFKKPKTDISTLPYFPLAGEYNKYNVLAAVLLARNENIKDEVIQKALKSFKPAFGRQEELVFKEKKIKIFLSKNPTGFNQSLSTINSLKATDILIVLNDRIPDGLDVSWIWDTNAEKIITNFSNIVVSGDRCFDMALRLKYAISSQFKISNLKFRIEPNLKNAVNIALEKTNKNKTLYILPTYSAMLEVRKLIIGKKIL
ncbi:MAG: MurT ligase domain-containing protein, partial [Actinobacteria bacterium]|nr:MurT ligase domain-containing protein [Actinomycetota bacterium]